jgi:hypothetical protein
MPSTPRPEGKPKEIAYKILGTPVNMGKKKTKKEKQVNDKLNYEQTSKDQ